MKLNAVAPKEGYTWIRQGIWLFKQNPLGFLMLVFMYVFAAQLVSKAFFDCKPPLP